MEHLSRADRVARGKDARAVAPLDSHGEFSPDRGRDPVGLLLSQTESRVPELVPVRPGGRLVRACTQDRIAAVDNDETLGREQPMCPQADFLLRRWKEMA